MQRRGESGQPVKGQRQGAQPKVRKTPTAQVSTDHSAEQFDCLKRERDEAREQQAATAEILRVIRTSPADAQPVFETIVRNAVSLCGGLFANVFRFDGELLHYVASHNVGPSYADMIRANYPMRPDSSQVSGRVVLAKSVVWLEDALADSDYDQRYPRAMGWRRLLGVPMLHEGNPIGAITVGWAVPGPASKVQEELLKTFADQAVIAIENTRLLNELRESLQQQTATSEVLKVISSTPGELEPVFNAMLANATRICEAKFGILQLYEGDGFRAVALHDVPPAYAEWRRSTVLRPGPEHPLGRVARTNQTIHVADILAEPEDARGGLATLAGARTILNVPMLKENQLIGAISIYRQEVLPFTDKQIELVQNFAAQAVIAIENARLLNELRQRTNDLTESLEQQTATSEVLKVISSSPGELEPVFDTMLANATRICEAKFGTMYLRDGDGFRAMAATHDAPPAYVEARKGLQRFQPLPEGPLGRAVITKKVVHIADLRTQQSYLDRHPFIVAAVELGGFRTALVVPMLQDNDLIGAITIMRQEVRPFTDKQIELVQNFAAQAVIAIENTRLLNELHESLQQQTATADVLKVISSSPGELKPVFEAMLESAVRICGAKFGNLWLCEGTAFRVNAMHGAPPAYADYLQKNPVIHNVIPETALGRIASERQAIQIPDAESEKAYAGGTPFYTGTIELARARTIIAVPLLKDDELVGAIVIFRQEVQPFTDKQIELLKNFAAQAVIAIENTRLLNELRESLQQQTATADVLKVISRSTFDLKTVLTTLVETAVRVCEADIGNIARPVDDSAYKIEASYGQSTALYEELARQTLKVGKGSVIGRTALNRAPVHILDAQTDPDYELRGALKIGDYHTMLGVPLVRAGNIIGVFGLARKTVRAFTEKQIDLVATFADQAVIAIENVRLFDEVEGRTRELAESLEDLRTTQDRLVQTQKLALLGQLTAGIAHEIKNPLNFVNNFSGISGELIDELQDTLKGIPLDEKARVEINELTDTLKSNFDKVVHHGRRADAIVKNMLQHSREGSGEHRVIDINALVEESLNLAWHGARAETQGFEIKLKQSFDPSAGAADIFPQDVRRALLNMISNGFYAATRRSAETNGGDYEPTVTASTKNLGDCVEIKIHDNGTGMTPDVKEQMFNPFFTTKPTGEGTGLGLSISHDIIVKQHGGSIEVDTQPGQFTEIRVILPRALALLPDRS